MKPFSDRKIWPPWGSTSYSHIYYSRNKEFQLNPTLNLVKKSLVIFKPFIFAFSRWLREFFVQIVWILYYSHVI